MSDLSVKKIGSVLIFVTVFFSETLSGQKTSQGEDILDAVQKYGQAEVSIAYPGFEALSRLGRTFPISSCDGKKAVLWLSPLTDSLFISYNIPYSLLARDDSKIVYTASSVAEAMQWNSYPTYKQYDSIMHILAKTYPDMCILDTIGLSINGKVIYALKISDNPLVEEDEPKVLMSSTMHGDELGGFVLMMRLAEKLASGGISDQLISHLVNNIEIWISPL